MVGFGSRSRPILHKRAYYLVAFNFCSNFLSHFENCSSGGQINVFNCVKLTASI